MVASVRQSACQRSHDAAVVCEARARQPSSPSRRAPTCWKPPSTMSMLGGVRGGNREEPSYSIEPQDWRGRDLWSGRLDRLVQGAADVDEVVGDDAEANPAFHSGVALVAAAVEAMSAFGDADATLASGAPFLAVAEPALLLLAFA